ncbi:MAG: aminotransferase class IV [Bacteroidota bacterium]
MILFNDELIENDQFYVPFNDRALAYGDGLFETIIHRDGKIQLLDYHIDRITGGLALLKMDIPDMIKSSLVQESVLKLLEVNGLDGQHARIKLTVWRKPGGLYLPTGSDANCMVTVAKAVEPSTSPAHVGIAQEVRLQKHKLSAFKTISALHYVVANMEKRTRQLDDLILLSSSGHVAECLYANVFWVIDGVYHTPSTETGCVGGVMRRHLIAQLEKHGVVVIEAQSSVDELLKSQYIFSANVTGCRPIASVEGTKISTELPEAIQQLVL